MMHLFKDSKSVFPSQQRIAEMTGLEVKSVRRHLETATKAGWLRRRQNKRRGKMGIWYEYFPAIPTRLKATLSRSDTMSGRENPRHDIESNGHDMVSTTTGHGVPDDRTPCRPNQVLNQVPNQALSKSEAERFKNRRDCGKKIDEKADATARAKSESGDAARALANIRRGLAAAGIRKQS
jgi:hypothetical protein